MRCYLVMFLLILLSNNAISECAPQEDLLDKLVSKYDYVCWQPDIWSNPTISYDTITELNLSLISSFSDNDVFYELYSIPNSHNYIAIVRKDTLIYNIQYINSASSHDYYKNGILNDDIYTYLYFPNPNSCWRWDGTFVSYFLDGSCVKFVYATPQSAEPRTKFYNPEDIYTILDYIPELSNSDPQIIERIE